jgi:HSP20 family molecular chaperone IbpA
MTNKNLKTLKTALKTKIKNFKPSKTFIAITSALIGIGGTVLAQNIAKKDNTQKQYYLTSPKQDRIYHPPRLPHPPRHFEDDFFGTTSIFREMEEMRREMDARFARHRAQMDRLFHETSKTHSATINRTETKEHYIYELHFSGYDKEDIQISMQDKTLTFSANKGDKTSNSNFYYSFYLGQYDQKTKPHIIRKHNKITVKIEK